MTRIDLVGEVSVWVNMTTEEWERTLNTSPQFIRVLTTTPTTPPTDKTQHQVININQIIRIL